LVAVFDYDQPARAVVLAAKNRARRDILVDLADMLVGPLRRELDTAIVAAADSRPLVTWIPANPRARRRRGYDQGRVIAVRVAAGLGLESASLLQRRSGPAQTGRSLHARRDGPNLSPRAAAGPGVVVLIDDVCTSGSSLAVGARQLRRIGADYVLAAVVARVA
jgi:predicted amidophosphoribosyltransferase